MTKLHRIQQLIPCWLLAHVKKMKKETGQSQGNIIRDMIYKGLLSDVKGYDLEYEARKKVEG